MTDFDASDPFAEARRRSGILDADFLGERIPMILGYDDVRAAARDCATFSSNTPFRVPIPSEEGVRKVRQLPIEVDPPEHSDYRSIVRPFFSRPRQPEMITAVEALIADMLDAAIAAQSIEAVSSFALPLQSRALTLLLGMPMSEAEEWISWGQSVFAGPDGHSEQKGDALDRYLNAQFDRAEREPGEDFFSALCEARYQGRPLTRDEQLGFANLAFAGGRDTVIAAVSLTLAHFAQHPDDLRRLSVQPDMIRSAVEEIVRVASPLTMIGRTCPRETRFGDASVAAGDRVALCWAAANRDETVFADPERLDISRKRNSHVAFGAGVHTCLGASHARLLLRSLIGGLTSRVGRLEFIDAEPRYERWPHFQRQTGYESLTLRFHGPH